jgi:membrane-associated phospholipid phosphatase
MRKPIPALTLLFALLSATRAVPVGAQTSTVSKLSGETTSDFKYLVNNTADDAIDVVSAPLHVSAAGPLLTSPRFYLVIAGAGALWGGSFALDQTMKSHLRTMSSSDADLLQNASYGGVGAAAALLYGYGLYSGDARARQYALTAGEGAGIATLLNIGIKAAFGHLRPSQTSSHTAFFHGGQAFVSGDVTPMFALAAGVSEYFDNEWYVAAPVYSLALLDGFGRMGHNAHWFSDVIGAALLGVGTTELFLYLHKRHAEDPNTFRIFASAPPAGNPRASQDALPMGVGIAFSW